MKPAASGGPTSFFADPSKFLRTSKGNRSRSVPLGISQPIKVRLIGDAHLKRHPAVGHRLWSPGVSLDKSSHQSGRTWRALSGSGHSASTDPLDTTRVQCDCSFPYTTQRESTRLRISAGIGREWSIALGWLVRVTHLGLGESGVEMTETTHGSHHRKTSVIRSTCATT